MPYIRRLIEAALNKQLALFPAIGLTGPRQSGKSTVLQRLLKSYRYVSFDDYRLRQFAQEDPHGFIAQYDDRVIFDEVQKVPDLFEIIKLAIDQDRMRYGKFVLTGSSQFSFLKTTSESLAGRIGLLSLLPLQYAEMPRKHRRASIYRGGYPELVNRNHQGQATWYSSYLDTYLTKDVRDLINIGDLRDFQRLIQLLAGNVSQVVNLSRYANDIGVGVQTIKRWLSVLEASYIIFLLPPFYNNFGKRIVKSPKCYFYDTGLVSYLTGIETQKHYEQGPLAGALFENYVIADILKQQLHSNSHAKLYYYRNTAGAEIDLIVDYKHARDLIEIKHSATFHSKMLAWVEQHLSENDRGYLLYTGQEFPYKRGMRVINYQDYLKESTS